MTRKYALFVDLRVLGRACLALLIFAGASATATAAPNVEMALKLTPTQRGVEYDQPAAADKARCSLQALKRDRISGWIVRDPSGRTLRRFVDSNDDNVVDQWCYYQDGIEVYRDIDADFNRKADQYRWLNTAGSRWGIDTDEDGTVDSWKSISAQEASAEVVAALAQRDEQRFVRLLLTSTELRSLGLSTAQEKQLAEKLNQAKSNFRKHAAGSSAPTQNTEWVHFSASQPGIVPAGTDGSTKDVFVYENVVAMVETAGKPGLVQIGTLVHTGNLWRLIDAPAIPSAGDTASATGFFFRNSLHNEPAVAQTNSTVTDKMQKLLNDLEKLQRMSPPAGATARVSYHERMATVLERLVDEASEPEQREAWLKQLADNVGAAVQAGDYPQGVERLEKLATKLRTADADDSLVAYVTYRRRLAGYSQSMQAPKADFADIQEKWMEDLESFVEDYPQGEDVPEAMLQLAMAQEFAGEEEAAKTWYGKIVRQFSDLPQAKKAAGAKRRLESVGQVLSFRGADIKSGTVDLARYKGKMVAIQFWATWCEPCKQDMEILAESAAKYGKDGFAVIGVNVDQSKSEAAAFLTRNRVAWRNIHEPGGLDSRPAIELGVLTLPTMLLIDRSGRVVNRNISVGELQSELKSQLKTASPSKRKPFR